MRGPRRSAAASAHLFLLLIFFGFASPASSSGGYLGIAPQDVKYYKSSVIRCKDGSSKFTQEQLNDDFCDCPDGSDEPGTSACPEGKFYCANAGHIPKTIFSSRVNDDICDCCDGSDEYSGNVKCSNTCWKAGKEAREKLKKKIVAHQEGIGIRNQEIKKAKQAFDKEEAELTQLKSEEKNLKWIFESLKEQKERIEKAEEEERNKSMEEEKRLRDAQRNATEQKEPSEHPQIEETEDPLEMQSTLSDQLAEAHEHSESSHATDHIRNEASHVSKDLAVEQDGITPEASNDHEAGTKESPDDTAKQSQTFDDTEGLSKEELGRRIASRWTGEHYEERENAEKGDEDIQFPVTKESENYDGYYSDSDGSTHKYDIDETEDDFDEENSEDHEESNAGGPYHPDQADEDDFGEENSEDHAGGPYHPDQADEDDSLDFTPSSSLSWVEKIQLSVRKISKSFPFFKSPVDLSEASRVRKEYDDAKSKLSKIQSRISSLSEKLKHDFGKEREFYSFYDRCFENKHNKYVYKVCPFKSASQAEGYTTTQLGRWDKFDESYKVMIFSNGDGCWNGPDRSLKVRLRCGLREELADVNEPSRCEYQAILSTPALCREEKLKELQQKLEDLNKVPNHDEL